jgi:hypothetical protein
MKAIISNVAFPVIVAAVAMPSLARAIEINTPKVTMPHISVPHVNTPQVNTHINTPRLTTHVITPQGTGSRGENASGASTIRGNNTKDVGGVTITVDTNRTEKVDGATITVGGNKTENKGGATITVGANRTENVGSDSITVEGDKSKNISSSSITIEKGDDRNLTGSDPASASVTTVIAGAVSGGQGGLTNKMTSIQALTTTKSLIRSQENAAGESTGKTNILLQAEAASRARQARTNSQQYETSVTPGGTTVVQFGDGVAGQELPTGGANVIAQSGLAGGALPKLSVVFRSSPKSGSNVNQIDNEKNVTNFRIISDYGAQLSSAFNK